jgi:hypothetical protein
VGELYAKVLRQHGWLLTSAEDAFESSNGDLVIDQDFFLALPTDRYPSDEVINVVQAALLEVGTVRRDGTSLKLDQQAYLNNKRYREGVLDTIAALVPSGEPASQLCATIPNKWSRKRYACTLWIFEPRC